jgi:hypothetical protein
MWRARARTREERRVAAVWAGPLWLDGLERFFPFPFICFVFFHFVFLYSNQDKAFVCIQNIYIASTWLPQWGPQDVS